MNSDSWKDSNFYYILCPSNGAFLQNLRNKTMTNKEIIEQVMQGNWCAEFQPKQEANVNNDGNLIPKLTPQNAEQEHWVQIILARIRGIPIESFSPLDSTWVDDRHNNFIFMNCEYRIKPEPTPTPLPISREAWSFIDKKWHYAAMDECGAICLYERKPTKGGRGWGADFSVSDCPLNINTDGINWETSLTERPEGV